MERPRRTYEIRLVTPAFMAGADQNVPELRVPGIRGCLRWWFRLAGRGASDLERRESEMFGSTEIGQRLVLRVRLKGPATRTEEPPYKKFPFDHQYLWFSMRPDKDSPGAIRRPSVAAGTVFTLEAIVPPAVRDAEDALKQLDQVVSQWVLFGSIGTRSRRCAGSLWFASRLPAGQELPSGDEAIEKVLTAHRESLPIEFVISTKQFDDWRAAIQAAGNHYRGRRKEVRDRVGRRGLPALGWPIMKFPGAKGDDIIVDDRESERMASPVLLKVIPDGAKFRWLLVVVKQPFAERVRSGEGEIQLSEVLGDFGRGFEGAKAPDPRRPSRPPRR